MTASERIRAARVNQMKDLTAGQPTDQLKASLSLLEAALEQDNAQEYRLCRAVIIDVLEERGAIDVPS